MDSKSCESSVENTNECYIFLKKHGMVQYWSQFDQNGYDDLNQLMSMTSDQLEEALSVDMKISKIGHCKKLKALLTIESLKDKDEEKQPVKTADKAKLQKLPDAIAERLLIPNPLTEKHKFFNEILIEIFRESYEMMSVESFTRYVISQRETRWRLKITSDKIKSYEAKLADSPDDHWQNVRNYTSQTVLTHKDLKIAEQSEAFVGGILKTITDFITECKNMKSNLFMNGKICNWKANELHFLDNLIKECGRIDSKFVKVKGDITRCINYLNQRVVKQDAEHHERKRSKRRAKENSRKAIKRKHMRDVRSAINVLGQVIPSLHQKEIIDKVTNADFNFSITTQMLIQKELSLLKTKTSKGGLEFLIGKNVFNDEATSMILKTLERMSCPRKKAKKAKPSLQLSIAESFGFATRQKNASSDSSSSESSSGGDICD
eukprot:gene1531-1694_t